MIFYVCSYGGCGSKMLCKALKKYGTVAHIHSRNPPTELEFVNLYTEFFNGEKVPEKYLNQFKVIYIYRNPIKSCYSRFANDNPNSLRNIQCQPGVSFKRVIEEKKDLYGFREFYDNYTTKNPKRNYKIICVKYEDIFDKQNELSKILNIGPLGLVKKETQREQIHLDVLTEIYKEFNEVIDKNDFIFIS